MKCRVGRGIFDRVGFDGAQIATNSVLWREANDPTLEREARGVGGGRRNDGEDYVERRGLLLWTVGTRAIVDCFLMGNPFVKLPES